MGTPPEPTDPSVASGIREPLVYCLTRDRDLTTALDDRLEHGALVFFYNDAARLHQAIVLRPPSVVVIDTAAVRAEFGDAGLGPVVASSASARPRLGLRSARDRAPTGWSARRPAWVVMLSVDVAPCGEAVAALSG